MTQQLERLSFPRKVFPFAFDELRAQQRKGFLSGRLGMKELEESLKNLSLLSEKTTVFPGHGGKTDIKSEKRRLDL